LTAGALALAALVVTVVAAVEAVEERETAVGLVLGLPVAGVVDVAVEPLTVEPLVAGRVDVLAPVEGLLDAVEATRCDRLARLVPGEVGAVPALGAVEADRAVEAVETGLATVGVTWAVVPRGPRAEAGWLLWGREATMSTATTARTATAPAARPRVPLLGRRGLSSPGGNCSLASLAAWRGW
jgi:hypothetical protein